MVKTTTHCCSDIVVDTCFTAKQRMLLFSIWLHLSSRNLAYFSPNWLIFHPISKYHLLQTYTGLSQWLHAGKTSWAQVNNNSYLKNRTSCTIPQPINSDYYNLLAEWLLWKECKWDTISWGSILSYSVHTCMLIWTLLCSKFFCFAILESFTSFKKYHNCTVYRTFPHR